MKKMLSIILASLLLIGLLAACSKDPAETAPSTQTVPTVVVDPTGTELLQRNILQLMEEQEYPKCFGGCYLEDGSNVLVILSNDIKELQPLLEATLADHEENTYRFQENNVAYIKLLEVYQQVQDNMDILNAMGVPISAIEIDACNSRVAVGIENLNSGSTKAITELVKSPLLYLYNSSEAG